MTVSERWGVRGVSAAEGLAGVADGSVACAVTSPPYKNGDGFTWDLMRQVFSALLPKLQTGGLLFVNFGHLAEDKSRPHRLVCELETLGFELAETIIWRKNHFTPLPGRRRLNGLFEFVFVLVRAGDRWDFDRLACGVPYQDEGNVDRFAGGVNLRCGGNVWDIDLPTIQRSEQRRVPHQFPLELPVRALRLAHLAPSSLVVDPFCGGGTTGEAALRLGHRFLGFEVTQATAEAAAEWLAAVASGVPPAEPCPSLALPAGYAEAKAFRELPPAAAPVTAAPPLAPVVPVSAPSPVPGVPTSPRPAARRRRTLGRIS